MLDRNRQNGFESIELRSFEQALLVLDVGSFRKAAALQGVQPSAVSRRIRILEDAIGVGLFQRQKHGAEPTAAGRKILQRARRVVDEVRLILRASQLAGEGREGMLCIGVVASIAGGGARDLLTTFLDAHPGVELAITEGSSRGHIGKVQGLCMDATFVVGRPPALGCVMETLWSDPIMMALPERHRLASTEAVRWLDLHDERFLVSRMDPGPEIQDYIVQHLAALGHHPLVESPQVGRDTLMALIGLGLGVSLVSGAEAAVSYPGVVFRPLHDDLLPYSVVWSEQNDSPMLRRFMSLARRWSSERKKPIAGLPRTPDPSP